MSEQDRLFRPANYRDFALLAHLMETNTLIYTPEKIVDLNTDHGFFDAGIQSLFSGHELTRIKMRTQAAKEIKRKAGENPNGLHTLPFGVSYDFDKKKFSYKSDIYKIRNLFELFHDEGIHNFRELERLTGFHHRNIPNLLRNQVYIGWNIPTNFS